MLSQARLCNTAVRAPRKTVECRERPAGRDSINRAVVPLSLTARHAVQIPIRGLDKRGVGIAPVGRSIEIVDRGVGATRGNLEDNSHTGAAAAGGAIEISV